MSRPTSFQKEIALALGISLRGADSLIAAARIRDHVALAVDPDDCPRPPTEKQVRFAKDLGVYTEGDSFRVCAARIQGELTKRNADALRRLRLKPGDTVEYARRGSYDDAATSVVRSRHVVSSIGADLRVYFKAPRGESGGWPSQLRRAAEENDNGSSDKR